MLKAGAIFKSGMVLQRDSDVKIFGETDIKFVEVIFDQKSYLTESSNNKWVVTITTQMSSVPKSLIINGKNDDNTVVEQIIIDDILLGDVWLAGGQSNMELELRNSFEGEKIAENADYEQIRFINIPKYPLVDEELIRLEDNTSWLPVKGENCGYMSAVAYYFATKIHETTKVPIGIIDCYWGGTSATCWFDEEHSKDIPEVKDYLQEWADVCNSKTDQEYDKEVDDYNELVRQWQSRFDNCRINHPELDLSKINEMAGPYPWPMPRGRKSAFRPFGLHKSMISRIAPYTIKGIIYYQAEEDCERGAFYSKLNSAVIQQWRDDFSSADNTAIPFYLTQLPMFINAGEEENYSWCVLRQQQEKCCDDNDNTWMAVICDCGEYDNIHPIDKKTPGHRLANQALMHTYGLDIKSDNLKIHETVFCKNTCTLIFENTYEGLCYRQTDGTLLTSQGENISLLNGVANNLIYGFEVKGKEGYYKPEIVIDNNSIILTGMEDDILEEIRYGWFNYGVVNLYNSAGNPLKPLWIKNKG